MTTGLLYEVRQPSLCERMEEVGKNAREVGGLATTADILEQLARRSEAAARIPEGFTRRSGI